MKDSLTCGAQYLNGKFCDDHSLIRGMQEKHVIGHKGLRAALYYHWKFDTELFSTERDRVQLAAILLFLAYTGARPGAISGECLQGHPPHKRRAALPRCEADAPAPSGRGTSIDDESDHPLGQGQTQAKRTVRPPCPPLHKPSADLTSKETYDSL